MQNNSSHLRQFVYGNKFKLSFDNTLVFTGNFPDGLKLSLLGKNLYIPLTPMHPAFTLKITGFAWPGLNEMDSVRIEFPSAAACEAVASFDFTGEIFYIDA